MLLYLDALIAALTVRDRAAVERLLAHPLARILTESARDETLAIAAGRCDVLAAPLRVMQLRHLTAELLRDAPTAVRAADIVEGDPLSADRSPGGIADAPRPARVHAPRSARRPARMVQMELPLSA